MDEIFDIFKIRNNNIKPHRGCILISDPFSQDLYFKRSVVLISEYNNDGAIGFILNKSTNESLSNVLDNVDVAGLKISIGGPVSTDTIHFIHLLGNDIPNSVHVFDDLFWGGDFEIIKEKAKHGIVNQENIRFFAGYSGWHAEQLDREIQNNYWLVSDFNVIEIMKMKNKNLWKYALSKLGEPYKQWLNYPENPYLN